MAKIEFVGAMEILDSRGNPTVCATVGLSDGSRGSAQVPSGASTGKHEAVELRDGDPSRYGGKGVRRAVANIDKVIGPQLRGAEVDGQADLDRRLIELDGTPDKSRLGANAILAVSCAYARAQAQRDRMPLWVSLAQEAPPKMPAPMVNIISGGLHAGSLIEVQDFLAIPHGFGPLGEKLEAVAAVHRNTRDLLAKRGYRLTGVADEGGWGPALERNEIALDILTETIHGLGFADKVSIGIDIAAAHFLENGIYHLRSEQRKLERNQMVDLLASWIERYPVSSIEDGLDEDDWEGWSVLTRTLGSRIQTDRR